MGRAKKNRSLIAFVVTLAIALVSLGEAFAQTVITRLGGANRYETMSTIVDEGFSKSEWAVIATGDNFPDALASSALAGVKGCPVLLTQSGHLTDSAKTQIRRLGVKNAYIMGGQSAIAGAVEDELRDEGVACERVFGGTRVETSVEAMKVARQAGSRSDAVIIARGDTFADALSIGSWAYHSKSPIILTENGGTLSSDAVYAITSDPVIKRVLIIGGENAVSERVKSQLGAAYEFKRLAGQDRYHTSVEVTEWAVENGISWVSPALATGTSFPDALAGAALCGSKASPLLLVNDPSSVTISLLHDNYSKIDRCYILGGTSAVNASIESAIESALSVDSSSSNVSGTSRTDSGYYSSYTGGGNSWTNASPRPSTNHISEEDGASDKATQIANSIAGAGETNPDGIDTDSDGYPDWVELAYMGTNPNTPDDDDSVKDQIIFAQNVDTAEEKHVEVVKAEISDVDSGSNDVLVTLRGSYEPPAGQIFVAQPNDACPTGVAVKIGSVNKNEDGTVTITGTKADLSEVIEYSHINEALQPDWDHIETAEGVTCVINDGGLSGQSEDGEVALVSQGWDKELVFSIGPWGPEKSFEDVKGNWGSEHSHQFAVKVTADFDDPVLFKWDVYPYFEKDSNGGIFGYRWTNQGGKIRNIDTRISGKVKVDFKYADEHSADLAKFKKNKKGEYEIAKVPLLGILGEGLYFKISFHFGMSGEILFETSVEYDTSLTYKQGQDPQISVRAGNPSFKGQLKVEGKAGLVPKVDVELLGCELITGSFEPGVQASASFTERTNPHMFCTDVGAWLYVEASIEFLSGLKFFGDKFDPSIKLTNEIINEANSPLKVNWHWDDLDYVGGIENCTWQARHDADGLRTGGISGKVCEASNPSKQIVNAKVEVLTGGENVTNPRVIATKKTDSDGSYFVELGAGDYEVHISAPGHVDSKVYVKVERDSTSYIETLLLAEGAPGEKGTLAGKITSALDGSALSGVELSVYEGWNAVGKGEIVDTIKTDASGNYSFSLPIGNYTIEAKLADFPDTSFNVVVQRGTTTYNGTMSPLTTGDSYRIVLTWGQEPSDLDSHVEGKLLNGGNFHVYYSDKNAAVNGVTVCMLDLDDTDGNGPETITLSPATADKYYYYVYKYAGNGTVAQSNAQLKIYRGASLIKTMNVPTNLGNGDYWNAFAIINGQLVVRNTMTDSPEVSYTGLIGF